MFVLSGKGNDGWKVRCERRSKSQREIQVLEGEDVAYGKVQSHCSIWLRGCCGFLISYCLSFSGRSNKAGT